MFFKFVFTDLNDSVSVGYGGYYKANVYLSVPCTFYLPGVASDFVCN